MNFMMGSVEAILRDETQQKRFWKQVSTGPPSLKLPMIIVGVVLMHKGLL